MQKEGKSYILQVLTDGVIGGRWLLAPNHFISLPKKRQVRLRQYNIATNGLINELTNPFTNKELYINKDNGIIVTRHSSSHQGVLNNTRIRNNEWFHVHTNIFEKDNWTNIVIE